MALLDSVYFNLKFLLTIPTLTADENASYFGILLILNWHLVAAIRALDFLFNRYHLPVP